MGLAACLAACLAGCRTAAPATDPLPGAEPLPERISAAIRTGLQQRAAGVAPRTKHLRADGSPKYANRLLLEVSPYLRQHAHNPVDWYPWGDDAFEAARRLQRPVLLSIGYSTCHWCHVMEEESFEDEEIARYLNEHYVAIKVDREQRPDLDSIYMTAVQALTGGGGGWPMTVWLTPGREPFYGGTYFPARDGDRTGMPGFLTVLAKLSESYRTDAGRVTGAAADLASHVRELLSATVTPRGDGQPIDAGFAADVFDAMLSASQARYDPAHGGARGARKFPSALPLRALLRHHRRSGNEHARNMAVTTLEKMAAGGIHDALAGGFHRYSVDPSWRVPHFEKMLYDNALLAMAYIEAWQLTGREDFAAVARDIIGWTRREMTSLDGGFYSAIDADSRAPDGSLAEGYAYTWTPQETGAVLGAAAAPLFDAAYGVTAAGNAEGRSVLFAAASADDLARTFSMTAAQVQRSLQESRALLLAARGRRPQPLRDDKILTAWNGLMISAFARASMAFGDDDARRAAARAADLLLRDWNTSGALVRSRVGERAQPEAFLDDYAFLTAGLLDLYDAGDGAKRLEQAIALDAAMEKRFEDPAGGFWLSAAGGERTAGGSGDLLVREKPRSDGAEPSGNSVAILNLLRLAELTGVERYRERAERALAAIAGLLSASPLALGEALLALDFAHDAPKEIVLVSAGDRTTLAPLLQTLGSSFVPNRVVIAVTGDTPREGRLPLAEDKTAIGGKPTAYVCEGRVCRLPTHDASIFASQLLLVRPLR